VSILPNNDSFVFIIGSPRSGTTILGEILDKHNEISQWYEPYFVWDRSFRNCPDDERTAEEATPRIVKQVCKDFLRYKKMTGSKIIVDKSPRNSLKIPFIMKIFPQARFIHILRDGRDVTLSINKKWRFLKGITDDSKTSKISYYRTAFEITLEWLNKQPFYVDKMRAFWFETHGHMVDKSKHLNKMRWNGNVGWGPRFKGWQDVFSQSSLLQFNAHQWLKCIERIQKNWDEIAVEKKMEIRYEELISYGGKIITEILKFLDMKPHENFYSSIPKLKKYNSNKWRTEFTGDQLNEINPILLPKLTELGYEDIYRQNSAPDPVFSNKYI